MIAAIIGGGLKAFGFEFRPINSLPRQILLGDLGLVLILLSHRIRPLVIVTLAVDHRRPERLRSAPPLSGPGPLAGHVGVAALTDAAGWAESVPRAVLWIPHVTPRRARDGTPGQQLRQRLAGIPSRLRHTRSRTDREAGHPRGERRAVPGERLRLLRRQLLVHGHEGAEGVDFGDLPGLHHLPVSLRPIGSTPQDDYGGSACLPSGRGFYELPDTGTYTIEITSYNQQATGSYTLGLSSPGTCESGPIAAGETRAAIDPDDCSSEARGIGYYADRYSFTGTKGQKISIFATSQDFTVYVYLFEPIGSTPQSDYGGSARLPSGSGFYELPDTGTYTIEVTSYNQQATGSYTLEMSGP